MDHQNGVYIFTVKYYSALKRKEILTHTATWMSLEEMLSETSQSQRDKYCNDFSCVRYTVSSNSETQRAEWWLSGAGGRGMRNYCEDIIELLFPRGEKLWG